ncbi:MAG: hypothetical protein AAF899_13975 [Pseudomonadota bacterium]
MIDDHPDPRPFTLASFSATDHAAPPAIAAVLSERLAASMEARWRIESTLMRIAERTTPFCVPRLECAIEANRVVLRPVEMVPQMERLLDLLAVGIDRRAEHVARRHLKLRPGQGRQALRGKAGVMPFRVVLTGPLDQPELHEQHRMMSSWLGSVLQTSQVFASFSLLVERGSTPHDSRHCSKGMALQQRFWFTGSAARGARRAVLPAAGRCSLTDLGAPEGPTV